MPHVYIIKVLNYGNVTPSSLTIKYEPDSVVATISDNLNPIYDETTYVSKKSFINFAVDSIV